MNRTTNPDFRAPEGGLRAEWDRMREKPTGLVRPLVLFSGWRAPRWPVALLGARLRALTGAGEERTLAVNFAMCWRFETAIARAIAAVEGRWPCADPERTIEVDVIGVSMGGIVARAAAGIMARPGARKRLRIARLFTLATPHRGAPIAKRLCPDATARDMRPGCDFLRRLSAAPMSHELVCYARLGDWWVGASNAAPEGRDPIWLDAWAALSHLTITTDRLIRTDIARRLRGEEPIGRASRPPRD